MKADPDPTRPMSQPDWPGVESQSHEESNERQQDRKDERIRIKAFDEDDERPCEPLKKRHAGVRQLSKCCVNTSGQETIGQ